MNGNELKKFIRKHGTTESPVMLDNAGQITRFPEHAVYEVNENQYGGGFYCAIVRAHRTSRSAGIHGTPSEVMRFIGGRILFGEVDNS